MLTSKQFLLGFLVATSTSLAGLVGFSMQQDPYALFHSTDGPTARVIANERLSKHLFSYRYIPENFDSLLIGPSVSGNIDSSRIPNLRVYNASLDGSNISELKVLVDIVSSRRPLKCLFIALHPVLLHSHLHRTQFLKAKQYWVAYGSIDLAKTLWTRLRTGSTEGQFSPWGRSDFNRFGGAKPPLESTLQKALQQTEVPELLDAWSCDTQAVDELRELLLLCREQHTRVVVFYPPIPKRLGLLSRRQRIRFQQRLAPLLEGATLFDFNNSDLIQESNFVDEVHLTDIAAHHLTDRLVELSVSER